MFRGKKPRENTANKKLLDEVKKRCEEWNKLPDGKQKRAIKKQILTDVVEWWKGEGGRFLKKRESDSKWQEVTDSTVARETVCQQFRDISNKAKKKSGAGEETGPASMGTHTEQLSHYTERPSEEGTMEEEQRERFDGLVRELNQCWVQMSDKMKRYAENEIRT
mmetsp:Transcript_25261/g.53853  ORF Transcript_25261/g.53853 Transcript_25261/m.53853 type:complete len:164 (+) Transcript_25261:2-493(+)